MFNDSETLIQTNIPEDTSLGFYETLTERRLDS